MSTLTLIQHRQHQKTLGSIDDIRNLASSHIADIDEIEGGISHQGKDASNMLEMHCKKASASSLHREHR